jgi:hypothetical protein
MPNNINSILFFSAILLYYVRIAIVNRKRKNIKSFNIYNNGFFSILEKLSLDMNNQEIEIFNNEISLFDVKKYQNGAKWGLKIYLRFEANPNSFELTIDKLTEYFIPDVEASRDNSEIIIDIKNNLEYGVKIIRILLNEVFRLDPLSKFKIFFLKKSFFI